MSNVRPNGRPLSAEASHGSGFPRSARLLRHADFDEVYRKGRRHFATHMTVFYLLRPESENARIGLTVGRVLGGAVLRNRIKRRLREAIRMERPIGQAAMDIVINPKKNVLSADFSEIRSEVSRAFEVISKSVQKGSRQ